jgi:hypothetical protein
MGSEVVTAETVRALAGVAGIEVPDEDIPKLAAALTQHLASIESLPVSDMPDVESPLIFKVTWDE